MLLEQFNVHVPAAMLEYAKQTESKVRDLRKQLEGLQWFNGKPADLRPIPQVLLDADAPDRVDDVVTHLRGYWGPGRAVAANESVESAGTVGGSQVRQYLRQFADGGSDLVGPALDMLARIRVIGRDDATDALRSFLGTNSDFQGAFCTALGAAKDSSSVLTYFVNDVAEEFDLIVGGIEDATASGRPILFIDDFLGTGTQSVDIVQSWIGARRTRRSGEERKALEESIAALFQKRKLGLVFAAATGNGQAYLEEELRDKLGLDVTVHVSVARADLPRLDLSPSSEADRRLVEFVRSRGEILMRNYKGKARPEEKVAERLLGYGNDGFLVASAFNTPTASLTALWAADESWRPLLPRRSKT